MPNYLLVVSNVVVLVNPAAFDFLIVISRFSLKILVQHLLMTLISAYLLNVAYRCRPDFYARILNLLSSYLHSIERMKEEKKDAHTQNAQFFYWWKIKDFKANFNFNQMQIRTVMNCI